MGRYGFVDAFAANGQWISKSYLAVNQGPIVAMIENRRSGLLWDLFMDAPEIRLGLERLGISGRRDSPSYDTR
ncbi:glucoamylase family protein [Rhizobium sp. TH2]|uniref:glucoamylase family protein n=1 Tax=Rhizobium sp. TH2 TaxID=2775403 RepID=UPI0035BE27A8